jgi:hypothetical protein
MPRPGLDALIEQRVAWRVLRPWHHRRHGGIRVTSSVICTGSRSRVPEPEVAATITGPTDDTRLAHLDERLDDASHERVIGIGDPPARGAVLGHRRPLSPPWARPAARCTTTRGRSKKFFATNSSLKRRLMMKALMADTTLAPSAVEMPRSGGISGNFGHSSGGFPKCLTFQPLLRDLGPPVLNAAPLHLALFAVSHEVRDALEHSLCLNERLEPEHLASPATARILSSRL